MILGNGRQSAANGEKCIAQVIPEVEADQQEIKARKAISLIKFLVPTYLAMSRTRLQNTLAILDCRYIKVQAREEILLATWQQVAIHIMRSMVEMQALAMIHGRFPCHKLPI